jgi:hypothetical protein
MLIQALLAVLQRVLTPAGLKIGTGTDGKPARIDVGIPDAERVTGMEANVA